MQKHISPNTNMNLSVSHKQKRGKLHRKVLETIKESKWEISCHYIRIKQP